MGFLEYVLLLLCSFLKHLPCHIHLHHHNQNMQDYNHYLMDYIRDDNSKIDGEYIVSRFTIPLTYNGTMSISATKIADRIY